MKLILFGATGGTGSQLVEQAIEQEYNVTAFARSPEKIQLTNKRLEIVKGNVLDMASIENAMQSHDAVLCTLGVSNIMDKTKLRANGTANIISAMEKMRIKRLICQSALGTGSSHVFLPFYYKCFLIPLFMKRLYKDHSIQEKHIKNSKLEWTIVRPGILTNGRRTGVYKHGFTTDNKAATVKISRADTADFMLKQLTNNRYLYKTPCVAY